MAIVILGVCRKPYMLQDFIFGLWLTTILKHPSHGRSNSDTFDTDFDTRVLMNRKNGQKRRTDHRLPEQREHYTGRVWFPVYAFLCVFTGPL